MTEQEKRLKRCCFTGHRPEKLHHPEQQIKAFLRTEIQRAIYEGLNVFITGMSRGTDLWAAQIVLEERASQPEKNIKLICAIPYAGFEHSWNRYWQNIYQDILSSADYIKFIGNTYSPDIFHRRNRWMVEHSVRLIAVYNNTPGGTKYTIEYAKTNGISCILFQPESKSETD